MFKYNFYMALMAIASLFIGQNLVYFYLDSKLAPDIALKKYVVLLVIYLIFTMIKNAKLRYIALSFMLFFSFLQWVHLAYYGNRVFPFEIYLFFAEQGEIWGTLLHDYQFVIIPALLSFPFMLLLWGFNNHWDGRFKRYPGVGAFFIFMLLFFPLRTAITGNIWGKQPSVKEFDGVSLYLSMSYFSAKVLPHKLLSEKKSNAWSLRLQENEEPEDINIILVMGESLTPHRMSAFGYQKETTPFLDSKKDDPNFRFMLSRSSGVSTEISLSLFFNNTFGLDGVGNIYAGKQCLFKLARDHKFKTQFYSAQSIYQLRYIIPNICFHSVDTAKSFEDLPTQDQTHDNVDDMLLVDEFKKIDLNLAGKNLFVFHMRGQHSPYNLRYPTEYLKDNAKELSKVAHYELAVRRTDEVLKAMIEKVEQSQKKTVLIFTSDHGEALGDFGYWGHGMLKQDIYEVPLVFYFKNMQAPQFPKFMTHFNTSLFITELLGYKYDYRWNEDLKKFEVIGNDLDGFAGKIILNPNEYKALEF